jgi:membrane associated rhomboid family serine protease
VILPLKDDVPSRSIPIVTFLLIALNVVAFLYQASLGLEPRGQGISAAEAFVFEFGVIPCRLTQSCPGILQRVADDLPHPWLTVVSSMFLHGGLFHVGGNMLYLWIFGNNVEGTLGHGRFLLFYLVGGVAAAVAQTLVNPASQVPMIGASGAVSGVLGAYMLLFPHATILSLVAFGFFIRLVHVPALIVLGLWIIVQLVNGCFTYAARTLGHGESGGVAWFAHIGGFLAGLVLLFLFRPHRSRRL